MPRLYRNGEVRDMTPEEREKFEKQMDEMHTQIRKAMTQLDAAKLQQQIAAANLKAFDSADLQKHLDAMKENLKALNSSEMRQSLARLNGPEFRKQLDELKQKIDSPEFRKEMELKTPLIVIPDLSSFDQKGLPDADYKSRIQEAHARLHEQIKEANTDPVLIQKAVDDFVATVNAATSDRVKERAPKTPSVPPVPPASL